MLAPPENGEDSMRMFRQPESRERGMQEFRKTGLPTTHASHNMIPRNERGKTVTAGIFISPCGFQRESRRGDSKSRLAAIEGRLTKPALQSFSHSSSVQKGPPAMKRA